MYKNVYTERERVRESRSSRRSLCDDLKNKDTVGVRLSMLIFFNFPLLDPQKIYIIRSKIGVPVIRLVPLSAWPLHLLNKSEQRYHLLLTETDSFSAAS